MRLIALNKPFDVLCQFTQGSTPPAGADAPRRTLAELGLPAGLYPAGRLDRDSEGLLLLTDDGALQHRLSDPAHRLAKRYRVQVDGCPDAQALQCLRDGVVLKDGPARALHANPIDEAAPWPREPPVRQRRRIPTRWLELAIDEGRNRQVRRMTAAVGHPTLRLIRVAIGPFELDGLLPGQWRDADAQRLGTPASPDAAHHPGGDRSGGRGGDEVGNRGRRTRTVRRRRNASTQWPRSTE